MMNGLGCSTAKLASKIRRTSSRGCGGGPLMAPDQAKPVEKALEFPPRKGLEND